MNAPHPIILIHGSVSPATAARACDSRGYHPWVFLGGDYARMRTWENALGGQFIRVDISRALADISDLLRSAYVEWVDELSRRYGRDRDWWFTHVAERNPLVSPFFLHTCYLYLLRKILQEQAERPHLIVAETWGLLRSVRIALGSEGYTYRVVGSWRIVWEFIRRPSVLLYGWIRFCGAAARNHLAAVRSRAGKPMLGESRSNRPIVIVDTFVHEDSLSDAHGFRDRYFPFLHEWLKQQGWDVWVLPTLYDIRRPMMDFFSMLRSDPTNFIIREDWLRLSDVLSALWCSVKALWYPRFTPPLLHIDVTHLVEEERWRQASSVGTMQAKALSRLPLRLVAGGIRPSLVIDWYENQKVDKALAIGFRKALPEVTIVGVQCFLPLPNYVVCFPTQAEWQLKVTPDRIVCSGRHQARIINMFKSEVPVETGAALRFQYLHRQRDGRRSNAANSLVALIMLPSRASEALELLDLVIPLIGRHPEVTHWFVKGHPDYLVDQVQMKKVYCGGVWPQGLEVWTGGLNAAFERADVVISTGSGTLMEAACLGIPVVVVGRQTGLTYNPMAWFDGGSTVCYSSEEISRRLVGLLHIKEHDRARYYERGEELRQACFEALTEESLTPYLGGLCEAPHKPVHVTL